MTALDLSGRSRTLEGLSESANQVGSIYVESSRHFQDVQQAWIDFPPLEVPHVGAVQSREVAKILLTDADLLTPCPNAISEFTGLSGSPALHLDQGRRNELDASTPNP